MLSASNNVITLERSACFGTCPVYKIAIDASGTVTYRGEQHVAVLGEQTAQLQADQLSQLVDYMQARNFNQLDDAYVAYDITDMAGVVTSLTSGGITKRIEHYAGDMQAPFVLAQIEQQIDLVTNSQQWTGKAPPSKITIFGSMAVREADRPITLPQGAQMKLWLLDISRADAASVVMAERVYADLEQLPPLYHLPVVVDKLESTARYTISAEIRDAAGKLLYITDTIHPVLTYGAANSADIVLIAVQ